MQIEPEDEEGGVVGAVAVLFNVHDAVVDVFFKIVVVFDGLFTLFRELARDHGYFRNSEI